jgi:hypothetical protein
MKNKKLFLNYRLAILRIAKYCYNHFKGKVASTKKIDKEIKHYFQNRTTSLKKFNVKKQINNLIVSFTSFPARIELVEYTLFSLLKQTIRPQKIILWLSENEFKEAGKNHPKNLEKYTDFNFEIQYVKENFRSYKKLIYSINKYPNKIIVTADDDAFYPSDWLELLYDTHCSFKNDIIAHRIHRVTFNNTGIAPYRNWEDNNTDVSYLNFFTGLGGILYPPNSLYKDATNEELFLKLCPNADDIWFYIMALLQKRKIRQVKNGYRNIMHFDYMYKKKYTDIPELASVNVNKNQNDVQLRAVLEYYKIYDSFYELYADNIF